MKDKGQPQKLENWPVVIGRKLEDLRYASMYGFWKMYRREGFRVQKWDTSSSCGRAGISNIFLIQAARD